MHSDSRSIFVAALFGVVMAGSAPDLANAMATSAQLIGWARSSEAADHVRVRQALTDRATLRAIDSEFVPAGRRGGSRQPTPYDEILGALAANPAPGARDAFVRLATDSAFAALAADSPLDPLSAAVRASASLPKPGPQMVDFWRKASAPASGYAPVVFDALFANGSPEAIELLVGLSGSKRYRPADVSSWIRVALVPRRTTEAALGAAARILRSASVSKPVKTAVLEALFARDVSVWFTPATWPGPLPDPAVASVAARAARARIAREAIDSGAAPSALRPDVEAAVEGR